MLLFLILGAAAFAGYQYSKSSAPVKSTANGGGLIDPNYDWNVWAADLSEIPDTQMRMAALQAMATAHTPEDIAALTVMADSFDSKGWHKAANRVRIRIQQLHQYYDGS